MPFALVKCCPQAILAVQIMSIPLLLLGDLDDVRTYVQKAQRAAALIYAHFKKEFGLPYKQ